MACPGASLLSSRDYHCPIITPLELEMALAGREWDGGFSTDFRCALLQLDRLIPASS